MFNCRSLITIRKKSLIKSCYETIDSKIFKGSKFALQLLRNGKWYCKKGCDINIMTSFIVCRSRKILWLANIQQVNDCSYWINKCFQGYGHLVATFLLYSRNLSRIDMMNRNRKLLSQFYNSLTRISLSSS